MVVGRPKAYAFTARTVLKSVVLPDTSLCANGTSPMLEYAGQEEETSHTRATRQTIALDQPSRVAAPPQSVTVRTARL
jgi:hypothetical protein